MDGMMINFWIALALSVLCALAGYLAGHDNALSAAARHIDALHNDCRYWQRRYYDLELEIDDWPDVRLRIGPISICW